MESKCAKMPPKGSKYTAALKHGKILYQNLHTRPNLVKKISVPDSMLRNSTHNITSGIESAISGWIIRSDDLVGNNPTQTSILK